MSSATVTAAAPRPVLVIHGGAGVISRDLTPERRRLVEADLRAALDAGYGVLKAGGSSLDAVSRAVVVLEDSPWFNAGRGAVFNHDGRNELDAAIMDGSTRRAGSVAGVHRVKNPVLLARAVMERSPHVMLVGDGAEAFAQTVGVTLVDPSYFRTEERWQQLQQALQAEVAKQEAALPPAFRHGTVGAVALDAQGRLAAATSTGGMTNKRWGRIGDAPVIGAGTYADARCAVSATGWGEFYIRTVAARSICARVAWKKESVAAAAQAVVMDDVPALGGDGGVIALDAHGNFAMPFNTEGMFRGWIDRDGKAHVAMLKGE
ncbi:MAG TPA: isoaspartyl peptidase/L-asparaginase [Rhodanobacteraceae bacterium]|nr:isoaspartyl peptidase/L-asparaginase [Rhodanobacteraceae bacterium]